MFDIFMSLSFKIPFVCFDDVTQEYLHSITPHFIEAKSQEFYS